MDNVFLNILNMSITASYIAIAVIVIRLLIRRAPKFITCILWGLVGLRLIFPFSLESIMSIIPSATPVPPDIIYSETPAIQSGIPAVNTVINPVIQENFTPTVSDSANPLQVVTKVAAVVWLAGIFIMLTYCLVSYIRIRLRVHTAVKSDKNIYLCDNVGSPFILGVIKPRIYLPSNITESDKAFVLAHEMSHIKRLDHIWKPLGFLLLSVYWFNPVLWVGYILLCRDIELACDERVVKTLDITDKKNYSAALLSLSIPRRSIAACPVAFGEVGVKGRIKSVLNYKKPTFWLTLVAVITCLAVSVTFLTNPLGLKIHRIDDAGDYSKIYENVTEINVKTGDVTFSIKNSSAIKDTVKMLKKVNISEPTNQNRSENRSQVHTVTINGDNEICFNADFTELWINNSVKPTLTYGIKNPEIPQKYFENINTSHVKNSGCDLTGVTLTLNDSVIIENGGYLSVTINNHTEQQITCGDPFKMFYKKGDKFIEIPLKKNYAFNLPAYIIPSTESMQKSYSLECFDLPKAEVYRFETTVSDSDGKNYTAWIEFGKKALGEYLGFDPAAVNGVTEDGYQYFHATVTKIESINIYVRPFENTKELKISDNLYVSTHRLDNLPDLEIGDEIRILYDGVIEENKHLKSTHAIYFLKDILPQKYTDTSNLQFQLSSYPADILRIESFVYGEYVNLLNDYTANKTLTGNGSMPIFKFNSSAQISAFAKAFCKMNDLENPHSTDPYTLGENFNNIVEKYTDDFLKENTLFIVQKQEGSGSYRHAITGLGVNDNAFYVEISKSVEGVITSDMGDWFIIFSVPNEKIANCTEFNAVRGADAYIASERGTLYYYKEPRSENDNLHGALSIKKEVELPQETYQKLLNELKTAKWINDAVVDRLSFTFDGYVYCGYYLDFSLEQKIVYCNNHFCGMSDEVYQILTSLK